MNSWIKFCLNKICASFTIALYICVSNLSPNMSIPKTYRTCSRFFTTQLWSAPARLGIWGLVDPNLFQSVHCQFEAIIILEGTYGTTRLGLTYLIPFSRASSTVLPLRTCPGGLSMPISSPAILISGLLSLLMLLKAMNLMSG